MHSEEKSWFHCGRCGSLFRAVPGESVHRTCSSCGRHPVAFESAGALRKVMVAHGASAAASSSPSKRKRVRHSRANQWVIKIVLGWLVSLAGTVWFFAHIWEQEKEIGAQSRSKDALLGGGGASEDVAFIRGALDPCSEAMTRFLQARAPEERSQFVRKPLENIGKMSRYYARNPASVITPEELSLDRVGVLNIGQERAVATVWKVADGRWLEAIFFPEGGEWRLDWEHFVRYSDHPWAFFLNGDGPEVGEFRVFARERLALDRRQTSEIGIVCYAPHFGSTSETGAPSPEFLLPRDSEAGRMLVAAFRDLAEKRRPFGDKGQLQDPDEMIRLRIRVRREPSNEGFRFRLEQVIACHWIATDNPGVTPEAIAPAPAK